jgi:hypothetical protein
MKDPDDIRLGTTASLLIIGCAGLDVGLFFYFIKVAINEAVRLMIGPW